MKKTKFFLGILSVTLGWILFGGSVVSAQSCGAGGSGSCAMFAECPSNIVVADNACSDGTVCCLPTTGVGDPLPPVTPCPGTCRTAGSGCIAPETPSNSGVCGGTQICCITPSTGGQNECQLGGGTCRTASSGCIAPETSSVRSCSSATQICCDMPGGGSGPPNTGGGSTTGSQCTGSKIGGVCFPSGTGLSEKSIVEILTSFISWILGIFGFIAILGFIISGLQYIFATGDEGMAETAKRNMKYSIIGIIVALSGWVIIKAVDAFLNASVWI